MLSKIITNYTSMKLGECVKFRTKNGLPVTIRHLNHPLLKKVRQIYVRRYSQSPSWKAFYCHINNVYAVTFHFKPQLHAVIQKENLPAFISKVLTGNLRDTIGCLMLVYKEEDFGALTINGSLLLAAADANIPPPVFALLSNKR